MPRSWLEYVGSKIFNGCILYLLPQDIFQKWNAHMNCNAVRAHDEASKSCMLFYMCNSCVGIV